MSAQSPPQISDLIKHFKITEEQLEKECSDEHLATLAQSKKFVGKDWVKQLGLSDKQIENIDGKSLDQAGKFPDALNEWHTLNGFMATYGTLVETFLKGGNAVLAGEVCKLLSNKKGIQ